MYATVYYSWLCQYLQDGCDCMINNEFTTPFFSADFSFALPPERLVLATGGRSPDEDWLAAMAKGKRLWCIDHGIDCCRRAGLLPERLIGDGDSAMKASWTWALQNGVEIAKFPPEKDFTDTQLALDMAAQEDAFVILTGAFGGRFDHAFSTSFSFAHSQLKGIMLDDREAMLFLKGGEALDLHFSLMPKALSLLSFTSESLGVNISNVKWPLSNAALKQALPYSVSNEAAQNPVSISLNQGILGIYICWNEADIVS